MMMVLGLGLPVNMVYLVHALFYFSKIPLIVFVDCHEIESQDTFIVSVEYFSVWIFFRSKTCLVSSSEFLIWLLYAFVLLTLSKPWLDPSQSPFKFSLSLPFKLFALVEKGRHGVWFTCCVEWWELEIYELWTFAEDVNCEVHPFVWIQISDDFTGETFYTNFLMQKHVELLSWAVDLSTEVFNGLMLLDHFVELELLPRLGLKNSTLTLGVMWNALIGVWTILSTCALLNTVSVTISFEIIVWSGFKLS